MEFANEGACLKKICSASKEQCDIRRTFFHVRANGVFKKKKQRGGYASHLTPKQDEFNFFWTVGLVLTAFRKGLLR